MLTRVHVYFQLMLTLDVDVGVTLVYWGRSGLDRLFEYITEGNFESNSFLY